MTRKENYFKEYIKETASILEGMIIKESSGKKIDQEVGLEIWVDKLKELRDEKKGKVMFAGNGASATMAEHMSHDFFQNADIFTMTCAETSHLTAISNDISFENVFAYRINKVMNEKDMLITISSSGNSPNVVKAIQTAKSKNSFVVTVSGMKIDNQSMQNGDLNFYVPAPTYGLAESAHAVLLHCALDLFLDKYMKGRH